MASWLLKEGNRLLQLNLNLKDLEDIAKDRPVICANQSLREWLDVIEKRLRSDDPVQPQMKELAAIADRLAPSLPRLLAPTANCVISRQPTPCRAMRAPVLVPATIAAYRDENGA
jgi:hypothetical protein